jgi:Helix-turn-helix domain
MEEYMTVPEVVEYSGKCQATIYACCARGILRFRRVGGRTLIASESLASLEAVRRGRPPGRKIRTTPAMRLVARLSHKPALAAALARELDYCLNRPKPDQ